MTGRRRFSGSALTNGASSAELTHDGLALWRRVADSIEQAIARGEYACGARLPGEMAIADHYGVNRHTIRRALAALAARGLVRAERGSGTYVEEARIPYPIGRRTRFSEIVGRNGLSAGGRLAASASIAADGKLASRLALPVGAPVYRLEHVRYAGRTAICVATTWLSAERFPDAPRIYGTTRSITKTLARFGVTDYVRASTRVTAALASAHDAALLTLPPGKPVLVVDGLDVDSAGRPILMTHARFAAERVELCFESRCLH